MALTRISIGIQARSTSHRFPNKISQPIGGKAMICRVIDSCEEAIKNLGKFAEKKHLVISAALLIPQGDPLQSSLYASRIPIIEGSEDDVLSRYVRLVEEHHADYVVRVTGDCPLIPSWLIGKHITTAVMNRYDYLSNVDERCRTAPDGFDCEVISRRLLFHTNIQARSPHDRQHVTTWIRQNFPDDAKRGFHLHGADLSHLKWSVDTPDDLERVRAEQEKIEAKQRIAEALYGKQGIHRI
jgi:spore coat polysaccharide biosynthesis protein SpsF (cytidylyltransferase family)